MGRYETYTFNYLLNRALARVPDTLDKREGSIIYDALAPACYELAEVYMQLEDLYTQTFGDTATGDSLARRAAEIGVTRIPANAAVRLGTFNQAVAIGTRFSIQDVTYVTAELITGVTYKMTCEQVGVIGNQYSGDMQPVDYISGLTTATLTTILTPGEEEETDDALRIRYYSNLTVSPFGGNITDYKETVTAMAGVGGTKVYPAWNGGGTVKLVFVGSDYLVPSAEVITAVQTAVDPVANAGLGLGIAPIGHIVTVQGVTSVSVNVSSLITLASGYVWADVEGFIIEKINSYMLQLRKSWAGESILIVRLSQIESAMLQVAGVVDVSNTLLNGAAANVVLTETQIPILGTVTKQ